MIGLIGLLAVVVAVWALRPPPPPPARHRHWTQAPKVIYLWDPEAARYEARCRVAKAIGKNRAK